MTYTPKFFGDTVVINAYKELKKLMMSGAVLTSVEQIVGTISRMNGRIAAFDKYCGVC